MKEFKDLKIAVAGTGYVGLSLAVLLAQHHQVTALDIVPEKVEMINNKKSPIRDEYIEKYLAEKELDWLQLWMPRKRILMLILLSLQLLPTMTARKISLIPLQLKRLSNW